MTVNISTAVLPSLTGGYKDGGSAAIAQTSATVHQSVFCCPCAASCLPKRTSSVVSCHITSPRQQPAPPSCTGTRRFTCSHLMCSHLALGGLAGLQALVERRLYGLHLGGDGLKGLLVVLLSLQSFVQTLLLFTDLVKDGGQDGVNTPSLLMEGL